MEFGIQGLGFGVLDLGLEFLGKGSGFGIWGQGSRVWGLAFMVRKNERNKPAKDPMVDGKGLGV